MLLEQVMMAKLMKDFEVCFAAINVLLWGWEFSDEIPGRSPALVEYYLSRGIINENYSYV